MGGHPLADYEVLKDGRTLPTAPGWSYRGVPVGATVTEVGQTVSATWLLRTTRDPAQALVGATGLYCVLGETGLCLDAHASLRGTSVETGIVAYRTGTRFALADTVDHHGVRVHLVLAAAYDTALSLLPRSAPVAAFRDHLAGLGELRPAAHPVVGIELCGDLSDDPPARLSEDLRLQEPGPYVDADGRTWRRRVFAMYRGAPVTPGRVVGDQVALHLDHGQAEADRLGFDGDQYNGWHALVPVDEVTVVRVEDRPADHPADHPAAHNADLTTIDPTSTSERNRA